MKNRTRRILQKRERAIKKRIVLGKAKKSDAAKLANVQRALASPQRQRERIEAFEYAISKED